MPRGVVVNQPHVFVNLINKRKIITILPAYNAAKTLGWTVADIPRDYVDEIILVDDFSNDGTFKLAQKLGLLTWRHDSNLGYGANQKTCYRLALERGADIVVMLHPDYQYNPKLIPYFVDLINEKYFDVVLGSRIRTRHEALDGGMPLYKYYANRFLTFVENIATGQNLSEWHTGYRAYDKKVLASIDFNKFSDDFVFDSQMLFAIVEKKFKIGEIPVPVRYFKNASSVNLKKSLKYGFQTLGIALKYLFVKRI
ncbi:MAG: glycosyltransferase family 2 protein [Patescibacteria group bacterium]